MVTSDSFLNGGRNTSRRDIFRRNESGMDQSRSHSEKGPRSFGRKRNHEAKLPVIYGAFSLDNGAAAWRSSRSARQEGELPASLRWCFYMKVSWLLIFVTICRGWGKFIGLDYPGTRIRRCYGRTRGG